jgi:serine/threonine-protein kinase RsbW
MSRFGFVTLPALPATTMSTELHPELSENAPTDSMQFEVTLPADVSAISPVVDWVMRLVDELEYGDDKEFGIEMALREALANAVLHGCKADPAKTVECFVRGGREEGILIVVRDPGAGFDLKSLPAPTEDSKLSADHGRGIFLIHTLMDEVTHEQNGTVIRMRKF